MIYDLEKLTCSVIQEVSHAYGTQVASKYLQKPATAQFLEPCPRTISLWDPF